MKKLSSFLFFTLISSFLVSQVRVGTIVAKGAKLVGVGFGGISYTNSESETSYSNTPTIYKSTGNSFSVNINPSVAWFVQDKLAVGGSVSLSFYNSKSKSSNTGSSVTSESDYNQPSVYIGPFARLYFGGGEKGMAFAQVNTQYGFYGGKSKSTTSGGSSSETKTIPKGDWNAGLTFGYEQFVSDYIGIYGSIGFNYGSSKTSYEYRPSTGTGYDYTNKYSRFYLPVNVGIQVHIPSKLVKK